MRLGTYQEAMYAAERQTLRGRTFSSIRAVRTYVDDLVASDEFQGLFPSLHEVVVERRGSGATWSLADCSSGTIYLADLRLDGIMHEVAHLAAGAGAGHGPAFARAYLTLVRREMGFHAFGAFLSALRASEAFRGADLTPLSGRV